jgi:adenylate kinase
MVGGAKGVGKTMLTLEAAMACGLGRIETGKIVFDYLYRQLTSPTVNDYVTEQILAQHKDLILDTHFAQYSDREEVDKKFKRCLEERNLEQLTKKFEIYPCLVEVKPKELLVRRTKDLKRRVVTMGCILEEMAFNREGYAMYLTELGKSPFVLVNNKFAEAKSALIEWIQTPSMK